MQPTDWGGDIEMIEVSAIKHQNLDTLLETVLLQADIMDLKASPTRRASGVVLEAKLDKGRGFSWNNFGSTGNFNCWRSIYCWTVSWKSQGYVF